MVKIAFFGHNSNEPTVRKRAHAFAASGMDVVKIMPRRGQVDPQGHDLISLGTTQDGAYFARLMTLIKSGLLSAKTYPQLRQIDVIYARNLDMLACAHAFRWRHKLRVPVIYEVLDIHPKMTGSTPQAKALRRIENTLVKRSHALIYSSPRYIENYFDVHHPGTYQKHFWANRLGADDVGERPQHRHVGQQTPIKLGWVGNLRCRKSMALLKQLGAKFAPHLEIVVHGYPAETIFPDFAAEIAQAKGMTYFGPYNRATGLADIYNRLDLIWAADWFEADQNSIWQIPNRIYEGGFFGVPALTMGGSETARVVADWQSGWAFCDPTEHTVPALIKRLLSKRCQIEECSRNLTALPREVFVEQPGELRQLIEKIMVT